jgi:hypothetical protein
MAFGAEASSVFLAGPAAARNKWIALAVRGNSNGRPTADALRWAAPVTFDAARLAGWGSEVLDPLV